jgi:hypothetical protein
MLYDYQREELRVQAQRAEKSIQSQCPLIEDEVTVATYNHILELEDFVRMVVTDWVESSADKIEVQRDDYMRKAKWLLDRLDVPFEFGG